MHVYEKNNIKLLILILNAISYVNPAYVEEKKSYNIIQLLQFTITRISALIHYN